MTGADVASAADTLAELREYLTSAKFSAPGELAHYVNVADVLARMRPAELALIGAGTGISNACTPASARGILLA